MLKLNPYDVVMQRKQQLEQLTAKGLKKAEDAAKGVSRAVSRGGCGNSCRVRSATATGGVNEVSCLGECRDISQCSTSKIFVRVASSI